jgi:hypothetical protein
MVAKTHQTINFVVHKLFSIQLKILIPTILLEIWQNNPKIRIDYEGAKIILKKNKMEEISYQVSRITRKED